MPSFLSSLQDKAQAALDKSGIGAKIPGMTHTSQAQQPLDAHGNPTNAPAAGASNSADGKSARPFIVENITHQLRALHNQYSPQGPPELRNLQVLITNAKGLKLDYEGLGRDTKAISKDFYLWGQEQEEDVKDVTDRLAYLNFTQGMLASTLSDKIDAARNPLKKLREAQAALSPRRAQRATTETQIKNLQNNPNKAAGVEGRIQELQQTLQKQITDDEPLEREIGQVKRQAIRDSEREKWEAIREYAEKLLLVSQTATLVLEQLPAQPPTANAPYNGHAATASARTTLQAALDSYKPGMTSLPGIGGLGTGSSIDTRSFGESHAAELSRVSSFNTPAPATSHVETPGYSPVSTPGGPGAPGAGVGGFALSQSPSQHVSGPVNPALLNNSPAPIPASSSSIPTNTVTPVHADTAPVHSPSFQSAVAADGHYTETPTEIPSDAPTVAETGIPLTGGPGGPGPATGSLSRDNNRNTYGGAPSYSQVPGGGVGGFRQDTLPHESAEEEKKRLQREERERVLGGSTEGPPTGQPPAVYESAEDEKKRLEREDREKLLRGQGPSTDGGPPPPSGTPPPYA